MLRAPTARLHGPIIVNAAPQLICRYAADGLLGWQDDGLLSGWANVRTGGSMFSRIAAFRVRTFGKGAGIGWHRMRLLVSVRNQLLQGPGGGSGEVLGGGIVSGDAK